LASSILLLASCSTGALSPGTPIGGDLAAMSGTDPAMSDSGLAMSGTGPAMSRPDLALSVPDQVDRAPLALELAFAAPVHYLAGDPWYIVIADFNHDGNPDLATASAENSGVSVLLGNGDGSFRAATTVSAGPGPSWGNFVAGDFDGDGNPDLAIATFEGVNVLLGHGDGTFSEPMKYAVDAFGLVVGDLDGDGTLDLATSTEFVATVLLGRGDGTFRTPAAFDALGGWGNIALGDMNDDGKLDLVTAGSVVLGNGDGTFREPVRTARDWEETAVSDFNGDGKLDMAALRWADHDEALNPAVSVLLGNGDGSLGWDLEYAKGTEVDSVAVGDLDLDGKTDVAVGRRNDWDVVVLLGNGDGTLRAPLWFSGGGEPYHLAIGDLNGDGKLDLVSASPGFGVNVLLNTSH
jgi:hypothetical protein